MGGDVDDGGDMVSEQTAGSTDAATLQAIRERLAKLRPNLPWFKRQRPSDSPYAEWDIFADKGFLYLGEMVAEHIADAVIKAPTDIAWLLAEHERQRVLLAECETALTIAADWIADRR
jgi:hypothetical protein